MFNGRTETRLLKWKNKSKGYGYFVSIIITDRCPNNTLKYL